MHVLKLWKRLGCLLSAVMFTAAAAQNPVSQPPATEARLAVTVMDHEHHPVIGLTADNFVLYDHGQAQKIASASAGVSACIGLLLDNSGSMRRKIEGARSALLDFVRASNPDDRFFVVNFNDQPYLELNLTSDIHLIQEALNRMDPRGGAALYDALTTSAEHLAKERGCQKRVLVVLGDGRDNKSGQSPSETIEALQSTNGVVIYGIALHEDDVSRGRPSTRKALEDLTAATGGASFFAGDLTKIVHQAAEEIRGQYVVTYTPDHAGTESSPSELKVEVRAPGSKDFVVRTSSLNR